MKLKKIKLFAIDSDGVLLNDTYSPAIKKFVEEHNTKYTKEIERSVWGSPQVTAGHNLALACKLPYSGEKVIEEFFKTREKYLKENPVEVKPNIEPVLKMLNSTGAKVTCYGGRNKEYSFDKFLDAYASYFDTKKPYIDINAFRPGVSEITKDIFNVEFDEVVFIDDINRVAEVCKALNAGFIGVPANMPHNFQVQEMKETEAKFIVNDFSKITSELIQEVDNALLTKEVW